MAGLAPALSVERFLQAVNTGDLHGMARIFGTERGSIAEETGGPLGCAFRRVGSWVGLGNRCVSWVDIELRMNAIALILRHDDYAVRSEGSVPGRTRPTTRVGVDLDQGPSRYPDVPFVVVQTRDGRWLVEEIGLERITSAEGPLPLDKLPEHAACGSGVHECDEVAARPLPRFGVDQLEPLVPQPGEGSCQIGHSEGEVV
jgi:hypothetical protein